MEHDGKTMVTRAWLVALAALTAVCLLGCAAPPPRSPSRLAVAAAPIDGAALLAASVRQARAAGASGLKVLSSGVLQEGDVIGGFVSLPADACMLGLARPGATVRDVDVFAYNDAGERIAADESPDAKASILVCPPHPARLYLAARLVAGEGLLAVGVMQLPKARAAALARRIEVRRPGGDSGKLDAWPGLERKIRQRYQAVGGHWEEVRRASMPLHPAAPSVLSVELPPRRCLDVMVVPDDAVQAVDVEVVDGGGRIVARGRPPGRDRYLLICGQAPQRLSILVRPRITSGMAAIIVAQSVAGAAAELSQKVWVDSASAALPLAAAVTAQHEKTTRLRLDAPRRLGHAELILGAPRAFEVKLSAGCSRIEAVAGAPLGPFDASLWNRQREVLGRVRGAAAAALFHCNGSEETVRVELVAVHHGGPVALFVQTDRQPPAVLLQHPLAAARLLQRLE
ncbi:MAG TPA: hypothetical protein ENK23_07720, partial [Sorangium sp.]|nr:hypothetical protein [Sorangium sp.]